MLNYFVDYQFIMFMRKSQGLISHTSAKVTNIVIYIQVFWIFFLHYYTADAYNGTQTTYMGKQWGFSAL